MKKYFLYTGEYISGWRYWFRTLLQTFLVYVFGLGLYLWAVTSFTRAKSLGISDGGAWAFAIFTPMSWIFAVVLAAAEDPSLSFIAIILNVPHWYLWFKNGKQISEKEIFIAGSIPAQFDTYKEDTRENKIIYDSFSRQINCIIEFVDFIYLDVISSGREIAIATEIIEKFNKPILVGIHLSKNGRLPSGEKIEEVINKYKSSSWAGILSSCVSMEIAEASINELKIHDLPFGYKVNLWGNEEPLPIRKINIAKFNENAVNLNTIMGKREIDNDIYKNLGQKFIDNGATILGGCCETSPKHTKILSNLR